MEWLIEANRWFHMIIGFVGLAAWWVPILTKKGGKQHAPGDRLGELPGRHAVQPGLDQQSVPVLGANDPGLDQPRGRRLSPTGDPVSASFEVEVQVVVFAERERRAKAVTLLAAYPTRGVFLIGPRDLTRQAAIANSLGGGDGLHARHGHAIPVGTAPPLLSDRPPAGPYGPSGGVGQNSPL